MEPIKAGQTWKTRGGQAVIVERTEPWPSRAHGATTLAVYADSKGSYRTIWADGTYAGRGSSLKLSDYDLVALLLDPTKPAKQRQL